MTCRAAINQAGPEALPERLARAHLWRGISTADSNVNHHWMAEQEERLAAAIRAALDEVVTVARGRAEEWAGAAQRWRAREAEPGADDPIAFQTKRQAALEIAAAIEALKG